MRRASKGFDNILLSVSLVLISTLIFPASGVSGQFNRIALQAMIEDRHISRVEDLIPLLPDSLRTHYARIFHSRSQQVVTMTILWGLRFRTSSNTGSIAPQVDMPLY